MNVETIILAFAMATALVAIVVLRERYDWPTDGQLLVLAAIFVVAGAVMFSKCGGWVCALAQ